MTRTTPCELISIRFSDHYEAAARLWSPPSPRGAVLYLHGIQSHGGWFESSAQRLADSGMTVLLPDRRGSGRNGADRGHAPNTRRLLRDCAECLDELHVRSGSNSFHCLGVSWGAKLALAMQRFASERIRGITLVAPGLLPQVDISTSQKVRVGLSLFAGRKALFDIPLQDPALFTANAERQQFIRNDPLKLAQVTSGFLMASRRLDRYAQGVAADRTGCPLTAFLAGKDRIIDNERTRDYVRRLGWPKRNIIEYPEAHHTLEFESNPEPYFNDLAAAVLGDLA